MARFLTRVNGVSRQCRIPTSLNQDRHLAEIVGVAKLAFDQEEQNLELNRVALRDPLTWLGNRRDLERQQATIEGGRWSVLYLDPDGFKGVNDAHGHDVGDGLFQLWRSDFRLSLAIRIRRIA